MPRVNNDAMDRTKGNSLGVAGATRWNHNAIGLWIPLVGHCGGVCSQEWHNFDNCSVQVGSQTGDTCVTSKLRFSAVVQVLEEADEARRLSRRTSRKSELQGKERD